MFNKSMNNALIFGVALKLFATIFLCRNAEAYFEFTNIKCESVDKSFSDIEYCYIKAVNRTYKYLSLRVNLFKTPITNITVKFELKKKANGYKPFLYNLSIDGCKFQRERKNVLYKFLYTIIREHTNMNHTCPYEEDVIVDKFNVSFLNNKLTEILPMPEGEYGVYTRWHAYNKDRVHVDIFFKLGYKL